MEKKEKLVKIDSEEMLEVIKSCGGVRLTTLDDHVKKNLDIRKYEAALGLQILVELKRDVPLREIFDPSIKKNRLVIPPNVSLKSYVNTAIEYFYQNYGIRMELQPIHEKKA